MSDYEKRVLRWECPLCGFKLLDTQYYSIPKNTLCPGYARKDCSAKIKDYRCIVISVPKWSKL